MYVFMHACRYACTYVRIYVSMYVCMYVCMYACIYTCIYIYVYIHVYLYTPVGASRYVWALEFKSKLEWKRTWIFALMLRIQGLGLKGFRFRRLRTLEK